MKKLRDSEGVAAERHPSGSAPPATADMQRRRLAQLYEQRAAKLTATLRNMFGNGPPDPEDVTQQAFQKLLERGDCSDIQDINAFLWRTARNLFFKGRRHEDVRGKYDFEIERIYFPQRGDELTPERVLSSKEELLAVNQALRLMPETRRHAFVLNKVEGLTVTEVAARLGIARSPATRHISRACRDIELHLAQTRRGREADNE